MDPGIPVPPPLYGGHERLVAMFIEEYTKLGHEVTLLAGPESVAERVKHFGENDLERSGFQRFSELVQAWCYLLKNKKQFALVHNFGRLLYLLPILNSPVKKIMTYGRDVTGASIENINRLPNKNLIFTACSNYCVSTGNVAGSWRTVYNAIDFSKYKFTNKVEDDAPLMFLGRVEQIKGVHNAIEAALATNSKLLIAGNIAKEHISYFKTRIEPFLDDAQIKFLGPLNDEQKSGYLSQSRALLFPIEWDEPFGMVMVEAMACGTPVLAFKRGSVPEVIEDGINGYKVNGLPEMIEKIKQMGSIDRLGCMEYAKSRFAVKVIAEQYLNLF